VDVLVDGYFLSENLGNVYYFLILGYMCNTFHDLLRALLYFQSFRVVFLFENVDVGSNIRLILVLS